MIVGHHLFWKLFLSPFRLSMWGKHGGPSADFSRGLLFVTFWLAEFFRVTRMAAQNAVRKTGYRTASAELYFRCGEFGVNARMYS